MSMHLQFQSAPAAELRSDEAWLTEYMLRIWREDGPTPHGHSMDSDFICLQELYDGATGFPAGAASLAINGGQPVGDPAEAEVPLVLLTADAVRTAAEFLAAVSFEQLWATGGAAAHARYGPRWAEADVRRIFRQLHADLAEFYGVAAAADHVVVKAAWV
ncbi:DUF1877 family protein [Kitasatospora viridis]|nr:DUF1877 family protein [Kitasatospora viridis]